MRSRRGVGAVAWLWVVGCLGGCDGGGDRTEFHDEGDVCLRIAADGHLEAEVRFPTCLSSSCDRELGTSCSLEVSDGKVVVTSNGASETTGASSCTDDCGALIAHCRSEGVVGPGSYQVIHGKSESTEQVETAEFCDPSRLK